MCLVKDPGNNFFMLSDNGTKRCLGFHFSLLF